MNKKTSQYNEDRRDIAFIIERLTGYYLYKLTKNKNLCFKEVVLFEPSYQKLQIMRNKSILELIRENVKKDMQNDKIISNNACS